MLQSSQSKRLRPKTERVNIFSELLKSLNRRTHLLCITSSIVPKRANSVEDLPARKLEAISDDNIAVTRCLPWRSPNSRLQLGPSCLQESFGNGSLIQVQVLCDGVDNHARLWMQQTCVQHCGQCIIKATDIFLKASLAKYSQSGPECFPCREQCSNPQLWSASTLLACCKPKS